MNTNGWYWAYHALRLGQYSIAQMEYIIDRIPDFEFKLDALRGLASFEEEENSLEHEHAHEHEDDDDDDE